MKTSKKIMIGVGVFLLLLLITWGICETAGSDYYNYSGHVIDIAEENGDTVITTLCGKTESRFTLKWYSREKYKKDTKDIQIGDYIMLSTTQYAEYPKVGETIKIQGREIKVVAIKQFYGNYDQWLEANGIKKLDIPAYFLELLKTENPTMDYESQEFAELHEAAIPSCDKGSNS